MSERSPDGPAEAPAPSPEKTPDQSPASTKPPRPKKWRRRFRALIFTCIILFACFRVALQFLLPTVLRQTAKRFGLAATYERHEMNLFGGDVGLWHLVIAPAEGGAPLLSMDYCRGDVSTWDLIRGRLVVRRLEAEGIDLTVERDAKGEIALLKRFASNVIAPATRPLAASGMKPAGAPSEIDLTSPLELDAFRFDRVHAHLVDKSVSPVLDTRIDVNLRLTDLRSAVRPSKFEMEVAASALLDSLRVSGEGKSSGKKLDATMRVAIIGLHPGAIAGYLAPYGIKPVAEDMGMKFDLAVTTGPCTRPGALAMSARLNGVGVVADERPVAGLDKISIDAAAIGPTFADLTRVAIDGGLAVAERGPTGAIRAAGMEFGPSTAPPGEPSAFVLDLSSLEVRGIDARLVDHAVKPNVNLGVHLGQLLLKNLSTDPAKSGAPVELSAALVAPGIARSIRLDGSATHAGTRQTADLSLRLEGVKPDALKPYLDAVGVDCLLNDATLSCGVKAVLSPDGIDASLQDVKYTDGTDLLTFDDVRVKGLKADDRLRVESIDIAGPALSARRTAAGLIEAVGFRARATPSATEAVDAIAPAPSTQPMALPKIEIGRLTWKGVRLTYEDLSVTPTTSIQLEDAGVELSELRLDDDPKNPSNKPAKIRAWVKAPGLAGELRLDGTVLPGNALSVVELDLAGDGLTAQPIGTYLKSAGIEPVLRDGSLKAHVKVELKPTPDGTGMALSTLSISDVLLKDASGELAGMDSLSVRGLALRGGETEVGVIDIAKPRAHVTREKDGTFTVAGIHTLPPPPPAPVAGSVLSMGTATTRPSHPATSPHNAVVILNALKLKDAELRWTDLAGKVPVNLTARVSANLDAFVFGKTSAPAKIDATVSVDRALDELKLSGDLNPSTDSPSVRLEISGKGIRPGELAAYFPPTIQSQLKDGRINLTLDAGLAPHPQGGTRAHVAVMGMELRDGAEGPALLKFDSAAIRLARYDAAAKVVALDEISLLGLEADVTRSPEGLSLLGMRLLTAPDLAPTTAKVADPATRPVIIIDASTRPTSAADIARAVAAGKLDLPWVTLDKLDLGVKRLSFGDAARPSAAPWVVSDLGLKNAHRIEMLGPDSENRPPIDLSLSGKAAPFAESIMVGVKAAPFAERPSVAIDIALGGVNGNRLLTAFPELAPTIDGSHLADGRLTVKLKTDLKIDRRDLLRLDFTRPFDVDFAMNDLEFRDGNGPILSGLKELRTEGVHIDPRTGGVRAKLVEVNNFIANVVREKDGIHTLGLVLKIPASQPTSAAGEVAATQPSTTPSVAKSPATRPAGEFRIDALVVSGMDFRLEDRVVEPPLIVPITSFDLEARDLSNYLLFDADKSTRFSLLINAGKVPLSAKKDKGGSGSAEERELFSQITASGKMALAPEPRGWVKVALSGLEIEALKGEARAAGFDASGGTFDADLDARFLESGELDLRPKLVFVDLGIKDSQDGAMARFMRLPISMDGAIGAVQDVAGQISIPLHVTVEKGKVDTGGVIGSVVGAAGGIIMTAAASAPLKIGAGALAMVGIDLTKKRPAPVPVDIAFDPGSSVPKNPGGGLSKELIDRLRDDKTLQVTIKHDMGAGDVRRVSTLANPAGDDTAALTYQFRLKRAELLKERARVGGQARGELGSGARRDRHAREAARHRARDRRDRGRARRPE